MAKRGRGRPKLKWSLNKVKNFSEFFDYEQDTRDVYLGFAAYKAEEVSERILKEAAVKDPRYNNYSGNLQRSYMVMARSHKFYRAYYLVNSDLVPKPNVTGARKPNIYGRSANGKFGKGKRFIYSGWGAGRHREKLLKQGNKRRYFRLTVKRHSNNLRELKLRTRNENAIQEYHKGNKRDRFVREIKKKEEQYSGNGYVHQYTHHDPDLSGKLPNIQSRKELHFVLTNLTPYANHVEKKGYRVLDYSKQNKYRKIVKEVCGKSIATGVKWMCDQMNRDSKGRFTSKK